MPGRSAAGRLWLCIHHLAVDGVSWRILVPDLAAAWQAIASGAGGCAAAARDLVPALGAAACGACAGRKRGGGAFVLERGAEQAFAAAGGGQARSGARRDRHGGASELTLPAAVTQALLTRVPAAFHGGIDDVLLTGLALAVADWCRRRVGGGVVTPRCKVLRPDPFRRPATRCCSIWRGMVGKKGLVGSKDLAVKKPSAARRNGTGMPRRRISI